MAYYPRIRNVDYLEHFGILGQKWGVKNGPPYPLGSGPGSSRSSLEKAKAKKEYGSERASSEKGSRHKNAYSHKKSFNLTDDQKKAIKIGAAVAATALIAYGGYKLSKNDTVRELILQGKSNAALGNLGSQPFENTDELRKIVKNADTIPDSLKSHFPLKHPSLTIEEDLKPGLVNPTGGTLNCRSCGLSFIFRQMGYDICAVSDEELGGGGDFSGISTKVFHNVFDYNRGGNSAKRFFKKVEAMPDGAMGCIGFNLRGKPVTKIVDGREITLPLEIGHNMAWKKENGIVKFIETQTNGEERILTENEVSRLIRLIIPEGEPCFIRNGAEEVVRAAAHGGTDWLRMDDKIPIWEELAKVVNPVMR